MPKTTVVPLDETENSNRAVPITVPLARQFDAQLLLISVYEGHPDYARLARDRTWEIEVDQSSIAAPLGPTTDSTLHRQGSET